jgi:protein-tyrosine phosphatase
MSVLEENNNLENNLENIELSDNTKDNEQKSYIEFSNYKNKKSDNESDNESDNDSDNDSTQSNNVNNDNNIIDKINLDDTGASIIYDIIRYFDELYVSGRTHIENNYFNLASNEDFNLVYPNIYVGNYSITTNLDLLKGLGITHIISVIPTFNPAFEDKFKYLFLHAHDDDYQDIKKYFDNSNEFIKNCLFEGGKVLIHCMVGRSRSVTIFMSFLIYILKGGFNQNILKLDNDTNNYMNNYNEISNMIEYKKLIENKKIKNISKSYMDSEQITCNVQELPKLSKKEENFIIYKKQKMINDIEDIISNYNLLTKELNNFKNTTFVETEETQELYANTKAKFAAKIFSQLFVYVKSHRSSALPNDNFINQLCNIIY